MASPRTFSASSDRSSTYNSYLSSTSGFQSIIRRSEDLDCQKIKTISSYLYVFAIIQMLLYTLVLALPSPPSTTNAFVLATLKAMPCLTLSVNSALRYFMYRRNTFLLCLTAAYFFHALGDFLLVFESLFTAGLGSFLIGHVLNIIAFASPSDADYDDAHYDTDDTPTPPLALPLSLPFLLYATAFITTLMFTSNTLSADPVLSACVAVYAVVLASCPWRSLVRLTHLLPGESEALWKVVVVGYVVYASSDSMLAVDRFWGDGDVIPEPWRSVLIMGTYWGGQICISAACDVGCKKASPWGEIGGEEREGRETQEKLIKEKRSTDTSVLV